MLSRDRSTGEWDDPKMEEASREKKKNSKQRMDTARGFRGWPVSRAGAAICIQKKTPYTFWVDEGVFSFSLGMQDSCPSRSTKNLMDPQWEKFLAGHRAWPGECCSQAQVVDGRHFGIGIWKDWLMAWTLDKWNVCRTCPCGNLVSTEPLDLYDLLWTSWMYIMCRRYVNVWWIVAIVIMLCLIISSEKRVLAICKEINLKLRHFYMWNQFVFTCLIKWTFYKTWLTQSKKENTVYLSTTLEVHGKHLDLP